MVVDVCSITHQLMRHITCRVHHLVMVDDGIRLCSGNSGMIVAMPGAVLQRQESWVCGGVGKSFEWISVGFTEGIGVCISICFARLFQSIQVSADILVRSGVVTFTVACASWPPQRSRDSRSCCRDSRDS